MHSASVVEVVLSVHARTLHAAYEDALVYQQGTISMFVLAESQPITLWQNEGIPL
jgi:hypothetical protein